MKKENSAPTMKDVAAEAGVALGTVSKVVNKKLVEFHFYEVQLSDKKGEKEYE